MTATSPLAEQPPVRRGRVQTAAERGGGAAPNAVEQGPVERAAVGRSSGSVPVDVPRLVVAAAGSGHGKTTVATGLMAALRARGLQVSPHKVGPDYIDPSYHTVAAGRPGRNLDPWLVGEERVVPLFLHGALRPRPADVAIVEGVMGLHDGVAGRGDLASTAHVARLLDAPVLLVLDASAQGRTAAATALGLAVFDPRVRVAGVVLNRVGSPRHESILRAALGEVGLPVLGLLPRAVDVATPSRHLGLVPVAERAVEARTSVDALSSLVGEHVDLDAVLALARTAPPLHCSPWDPAAAVGGPVPGAAGRRIAVAAGAAFSFSYTETSELLSSAGAEVVTFDPLRDRSLPPGARALVIGGGFPEMHTEALAANASLRADVAAFDGPVVAECAGLLYLGRSLDDVPMCGRLDVTARMTPRLTLGYREAVAGAPSCVTAAGDRVRGHEFHRTETDPRCGDAAAWHWDGRQHGFVDGRVHASYLHTHWAGNPRAARSLVEAAA